MIPKISIIVPVYNVEQYLSRCIDSILNQKFSDFELILVNDGSKDRCGEICDEYAKKDSRIKVIHKSNGGLSSARNAGIDIAKGEYIGFVDSDDWINDDMYEKLYTEGIKYNSDVVICRALRIEKDKKFPLRNYEGDKIKVFNSVEALTELFLDKIDCSSCTKIYKKYLFEGVRFKEGVTNEDFEFLYRIFYKSNYIVYINDILYNYELRMNSITTSDHSTITDRSFDRFYNSKYAYEFILKNIPILKEECEYYYFYSTFCNLKDILINKKIDKKYKNQYYELLTTLRKNIILILRNKYISRRFKISFFAIMLSPQVYRKIHLIISK